MSRHDASDLSQRLGRCAEAVCRRYLDAERLAGDTARAATSDEVKALRREALSLKEAVADLTLENRLLKKSMNADGENEA